MIHIEKAGDHFIFEIKGLHKLWGFKSQLSIPAAHIINAYPNEKKMTGFFGLRMPGTQLHHYRRRFHCSRWHYLL